MEGTLFSGDFRPPPPKTEKERLLQRDARLFVTGNTSLHDCLRSVAAAFEEIDYSLLNFCLQVIIVVNLMPIAAVQFRLDVVPCLN